MASLIISKPRSRVKTGDKVGRATVIGPAFRVRLGSNKATSVAVCSCECGSVFVAQLQYLANGTTKSCGCLRTSMIVSRSKTHGYCETNRRLYRIWHGMQRRCNDRTNRTYKNYGGRGISICEEWSEVGPFVEWALLNGYEDGLTIDRKDTNCNYEPSNCRWITNERQQNNRRDNVVLHVFGESKTAADWSRDERCKVKHNTLQYRILRGWSHERAITTPPMQ